MSPLALLLDTLVAGRVPPRIAAPTFQGQSLRGKVVFNCLPYGFDPAVHALTGGPVPVRRCWDHEGEGIPFRGNLFDRDHM